MIYLQLMISFTNLTDYRNMNILWRTIEKFLPEVTRPGRYAGNEIHSVHKDWERTSIHFALAFPDLYEIGMSNLGMEILYHILNRQPWIAAERVYAPWIDMEKKLRDLGLPLFSLESRKPLHEFDVLGISLQYELQYTNVLTILNLGGIPLHATEREESHPLVIAGGPCAFNPEPMADFLDAVALGDGEELVIEICRTVLESKRNHSNRKETLLELARIEGVYVPSLYRAGTRDSRAVPVSDRIPETVTARIKAKLDPLDYPVKPLVPLIEVTHDRYSLEIMRGCTRGCRFCHAGMVYRPVRERPVEELVALAGEGIENTGYDEISFVSLSTSDYSRLPDLLACMERIFQEKRVSLSFPSLRPDTFTPEMADYASGFRRSGLTFAPEAGTQRLRDVINKNNCEEDLLRAVQTAFSKGWKQIKLYFMIGLPSETREDLQGIADLVEKTVGLARRHGSAEIHVSISPFSPKPHTPFQWEPQSSLEDLNERIRFIRMRLRKWREVKVSWRDPSVTHLETVLGRGDRALGCVIEEAWKAGTRFDAWTDLFDMERWDEAFRKCGISFENCLGEKKPGSALPWSHLSKGISEAFLLEEKERSLRSLNTDDCRTGPCNNCGILPGLCGNSPGAPEHAGRAVPETGTKAPGKIPLPIKPGRRTLRLAYNKGAPMRFTSHLDVLRLLTRTLRRAGVNMAYSQGFHSHPKVSAGPPLPLGYTSQCEYIDVQLEGLGYDIAQINRCLPAGMEIVDSRVLPANAVSLGQIIDTACFSIMFARDMDQHKVETAIEEFLKKRKVMVLRKRAGKEKEIDIRQYVDRLAINGRNMQLDLLLSQSGTARVEEVFQVIFGNGIEPAHVRIERTGLFVTREGKRVTPMELN